MNVTSCISRRCVLTALAALASVTALLAPSVSFGSGQALASAQDQHNGRIAFDHHTFGGGVETFDIATIAPDGTDPQYLTQPPIGQGGGESAAWTATGSRIYFDSDRAGNTHVFLMNADGRHVRQITHTDGFEFTPAISQDGKLLAYEHDAADFSSGGIYLSHKGAGDFADSKQLTSSPAVATGGFDTEPDFSPDGSKIAFLRLLSEQRPTAMSAVFVVGVDGTGLRQLTPYSLNAVLPRWSPDGSRVLFSSNSDNFSSTVSANIYTIGADGQKLTELTHETNGHQAFTADWSPDGTKIVFAHATGGPLTFDVMNADGSQVTTIWHDADGTFDQIPAWGSRQGDD